MFPKFYEEKSGKKRFLRVSCSDGSQPKVRALEACWGKIEEKEEKGNNARMNYALFLLSLSCLQILGWVFSPLFLLRKRENTALGSEQQAKGCLASHWL